MIEKEEISLPSSPTLPPLQVKLSLHPLLFFPRKQGCRKGGEAAAREKKRVKNLSRERQGEGGSRERQKSGVQKRRRREGGVEDEEDTGQGEEVPPWHKGNHQTLVKLALYVETNF